MTAPAGSAREPPAGRRRSAARLAAVQALYQIEITDAKVETVIAEFGSDVLRRDVEDRHLDVDDAFFAELARGVVARMGEVDTELTEALTPDWPLARLETVLRAILRAGAFELLARPDVPAAVTISEYLDLGHAFFAGKEPGLINGVLDRLARKLRAGEVSAKGNGGQAASR